MKYRSGCSILGIQVLFVEHDSLKLFGQATNLLVVFGCSDALETEVECSLGSIQNRRGGGRPAGLNCLTCALATLLWGEFGGSCRTAFLATLASKSNRGGILPFCSYYSHVPRIPERSRLHKYVSD